MKTFMLGSSSLALALSACGAVDPQREDPDAGAGGLEMQEIPAHCGNGTPDPGEDCDGTPGCPVTCHVTPAPGMVAVRFRGAVTRLQDPQGIFGAEIRLDTPLWGRVVFPTSLADQSGDAAVGDYPYTNAGARDTTGIFLSVALWSFHPDRGTGRIAVGNGVNGSDGFYTLLGNLAVTPPAAGLQSIVLDLVDPSQAALATDALPTGSFPPAAAWANRRVYLQGDNAMGVSWFIDATIDELALEAPGS